MIPNWAFDITVQFRVKESAGVIKIKQCPYCGNDRSNLEISIPKCVFHCWACDAGGSVKKFLRDQEIPFDVADIRPEAPVKRKEDSIFFLPDNMPLLQQHSRYAIAAVNYLKSRGMTEEDIKEWDIRFATGKDAEALDYNYLGYVLFPFYGLKGLEYFQAASYVNKGYKLPATTKDKFLPKQRGSHTLVFVEGIFDATTIWKYTTHDIFMIFGKYLGPYQLDMLTKANYTEVIMCLDGDAYKDAITLANLLYSRGIRVKIAKLPEDKDPNDLKEQVVEYINRAYDVTESYLRRERARSHR